MKYSKEIAHETLHFLGFLRKGNPVVALTAECAYAKNESEDPTDEWARIAFTRDEHKALVLLTSYDIMQRHFVAHDRKTPTFNCRRIVHENIRNRMDVVKILDTSEDFTLCRTRTARTKKNVEADDQITSVFENLMKEEVVPKVETESDGDAKSSRGGGRSEGNCSIDSSPEDSDEPDPDFDPPEPPAPESLTPDHVRIWLTRTGRLSQCNGCDSKIDKYEFRMLHHPDPRLNPDRRVWKKNWFLPDIILSRSTYQHFKNLSGR